MLQLGQPQDSFGLHLRSDDVEVPARLFALGQNQVDQILETVVDTHK